MALVIMHADGRVDKESNEISYRGSLVIRKMHLRGQFDGGSGEYYCILDPFWSRWQGTSWQKVFNKLLTSANSIQPCDQCLCMITLWSATLAERRKAGGVVA